MKLRHCFILALSVLSSGWAFSEKATAQKEFSDVVIPEFPLQMQFAGDDGILERLHVTNAHEGQLLVHVAPGKHTSHTIPVGIRDIITD